MASPNVYPSGFNRTPLVFAGGPAILANHPSYVSGTVAWVDTIGGSNSNSGLVPWLPVATLAQGVTNAGANGLIIIGAGSSETLAAQQALTIGQRVVGCGTGSSMPRYRSGLAGAMFNINTAGGRIQNIYFPASVGPTNGPRVALQAASAEVRDCIFECGAADATSAVLVGTPGASARVRNCRFMSVASRPGAALDISNATDVVVDNCTVDGGAFGWADPFAVKVSGAAQRLEIDTLQLTNFSDFSITITGTTYKIFGLTNDGTSRVVITA